MHHSSRTALEALPCSSNAVQLSPIHVSPSATAVDIPSGPERSPSSLPSSGHVTLRPVPNLSHFNVDPVRAPGPGQPIASLTSHSSGPSKPWLYQYVAHRWDLLFGAYRRMDCCGLRGFAVVELVFVAIYAVVNAAICIAGTAQMAVTGSSDPSKLKQIGSNFGIYGTINVVILLLPVTRNTVWQYILGISFERAIWYHKWLARVAVAELAIHGGCIYAASYYSGTLHSDAFDSGPLGEYASGSLALFCAVAIVLQSLYYFRRRVHEWFLRLHVLLFVAFLVFGLAHEPTVRITLVALVLYVLDWLLRLTMWRRPVTVLECSVQPGGVSRLTFQMENFSFQAGQYVMVCIPLVSPWAWKPYTISSSPYDAVLTLHSKACGRWSRRLEALASDPKNHSGRIRMYVEGPYGNIALPLDRLDRFLLVAGGIGVTPLGSLYHTLCHEHWLGLRTVRSMRLVWTMRDSALITSIYPETDRTPPLCFLHSAALQARQSIIDRSERPTSGDVAQRATFVSLEDRVSTAFHCTQAQANVDDDLRVGERASTSWLRGGRPHLQHEFAAIKEAMEKECAADGRSLTHCAVLVCGPQQLVDEVRLRCVKQSSATAKFVLHEETFIW